MRFKSRKVDGYRIYAVSGINTISFGIDFDPVKAAGLLGFAIEREDLTENERYYMYGFKLFESVHPQPGENLTISTFDQPVQSFVWDDFTAKPKHRYRYHFHPLKGTPKNLDRSAKAIPIRVDTEPLDGETHDIFFNRGVASSQAYARRFKNRKPSQMTDPAERAEALQWLSRDLDDKLLRFIGNAKAGDTLLGAFYEFRYRPVADAMKAAVDRGVKLRLVLDAKDNSFTDADGFHDAFPRGENKKMVADAKIPTNAVTWREANPNEIAHNKFLVLLKGPQAKPAEIWTGSTNLSEGGIHGQTNVGHWVRDAALAERFRAYWDVLQKDPGKTDSGTPAANKAAMKALRDEVAALTPVPATWADIPAGTSALFSPRSGSAVLDMYSAMLAETKGLGCITLAFGISAVFKDRLIANPKTGPMMFLLLEKKDKPRANSTKPFTPLGAKQNVYQAWGSYFRDPLFQWTRETNARLLDFNRHVTYVHSKFLLHDPLGPDPITVTGSANFSEPSTTGNDENMLLIRGDTRVADIYFTEFNRIFFHYYFRSVSEAINQRAQATGPQAVANAAADAKASLFLDPTDGWLKKYAPGTLRTKRMKMFTEMAGAKLLPD